MDELSARYRGYLIAARKRSPLTADVYLRESSMLERFLSERGSSPEKASSAELLGYLVWRQSGFASEAKPGHARQRGRSRERS